MEVTYPQKNHKLHNTNRNALTDTKGNALGFMHFVSARVLTYRVLFATLLVDIKSRTSTIHNTTVGKDENISHKHNCSGGQS